MPPATIRRARFGRGDLIGESTDLVEARAGRDRGSPGILCGLAVAGRVVRQAMGRGRAGADLSRGLAAPGAAPTDLGPRAHPDDPHSDGDQSGTTPSMSTRREVVRSTGSQWVFVPIKGSYADGRSDGQGGRHSRRPPSTADLLSLRGRPSPVEPGSGGLPDRASRVVGRPSLGRGLRAPLGPARVRPRRPPADRGVRLGPAPRPREARAMPPRSNPESGSSGPLLIGS